MVRLVSDTDSTCQHVEILLSLVRDNSFMSWKVVLWVIFDINDLNRFGLMPTWLVLLQSKLHIIIMLVMIIIYEVTLVSFWCENDLGGNDKKSFGNPGTEYA